MQIDSLIRAYIVRKLHKDPFRALRIIYPHRRIHVKDETIIHEDHSL